MIYFPQFLAHYFRQIAEVKEKIHKQYGHEPSWQKLIFAGSILKDEGTIKSYKITENDCLVLMVRKV